MSTTARRNGWELFQFPSAFVLGFQGCDKKVGEAILAGETPHRIPSRNNYDWLGWGIYFWDSNPERALELAQERATGRKNSQGHIKDPFVLGAVINMGHCLNLSDSSALAEVKRSYEDLVLLLEHENIALPENGMGKKMRMLDCAVFELLHQQRADTLNLTPYDTVRGTYREGAPLYPGTDLSEQGHTQICVRTTTSILGYFRPIQL